MASCPVRAEQVLESHGRPLRITLSRPSDCAKYEITLDVALHFGPEDHSCAEKLNKNNDQVGRETLQLFKSGVSPPISSNPFTFCTVSGSLAYQSFTRMSVDSALRITLTGSFWSPSLTRSSR